MNRIWPMLVLMCIVLSVANGSAEQTAQALLQAGSDAVSMALTLTGAMALWSGMLRIVEESGDAARAGKALRKLLRPLFPEPLTDASWNAMGMNLACNMMGLGNAATPAGIEAARLLAAQGEPGLRALAMLLALNNSSLQLIPATVITLRGAFGAAAPADIWLPTLVSSGAATLTAAVLMAMANLMQARR